MRTPFFAFFLTQCVITASLGQEISPAPGSRNQDAPLRLRADGAAGLTPTTPLTIQQAVALADQQSPLLQEANASMDRARAGVDTAKAYTNPTFEFLGGNQAARPIRTPGVPGPLTHYGVSQTLEIPRERTSRIRASELDWARSKYRMAGIRLSIEADVKRAFYDVIRRKEQLAHAQDNLDLVEDLRRRVRLQVDVGEKGKLELTRAEAELARARAAIKSADVELANARAMLKVMIGSASSETFDAEGNLGGEVKLAPLNELWLQVLANHPALSEAQAMTARSRAVVEDERARRIPQPTFYGEYERQPDISFYRFGVSVPLPFWDRRKGPIGEAKAEVNRAEASSQQRRLEIMAALERAYDQYEISDQQVQGLQSGSLREAEAAVDAARAAYKFGERGIVEVLDAQRVLQGVRGDLLDALYARRSALVDLEELGVAQQ